MSKPAAKNAKKGLSKLGEQPSEQAPKASKEESEAPAHKEDQTTKKSDKTEKETTKNDEPKDGDKEPKADGKDKEDGKKDDKKPEENKGELKIATSFDDMSLKDDLLRGIYAYGFERPSAIQQRGILPMISGKDTIGQAQSGTGKTATFAISCCNV